MKKKKIFCFIVLISFLFNNFFAADIEVLSYDKYGAEQTNLFKSIISGYNSLKIKNYDSIKIDISENVNKLILALNFFVGKYPNNGLINNVYFALGEMYFINAISYFKKTNNKDITFLGYIKKALEFYEKTLNRKISNFMRQNISYRIIEIYFSIGDFKKTLQLSKNYLEHYKEAYLIIDTLYMLTINYVNLNKDETGLISLEKWKELKQFLQNINKVDIDKLNLQKISLSLGIIHFILGEYEESIENLKKVNSSDAQFYLGKVYEQIGKYVLAIGEYKSLILRSPNSKYEKFIRFSIGNAYYKMGDYKESLDTFISYKKKYPNDEYLLFVDYKIGCNYFYMSDFEKAIEFFDKVKVSKDQVYDKVDKEEIYQICFCSSYLKAYSYYVNKKYEEAAINFLNCYSSYKNSSLAEKIVFMAAWCLYNTQNYQDAEKLILEYLKNQKVGTNGEIIETEETIYLYYLLANVQRKNSKKEESLQNYQKIIDKITSLNLTKLYDLRDNALLMMLKIHYDDKNFIKIATEFHYILRNIIPKIEGKKVRVEIYLIVTDACFRMKYFKEAKNLYKNISIECRNDDEFYSRVLDGLAWCEYEQGNYAMAEKYRNIINDIINHSEKDLTNLKLDNFYELGNINISQKKYSKAIENYERYLKLSKNSEILPEVLYRLGVCYYREEYYSLAIERWKEIIEKYPNYKSNLAISYKIADTYYKSGKYIEAIKIYEYIFDKFDHNDLTVIESKIRIAQSYFNAKDYDKALEKFKEFITIYPDEEKTREVIELIETTLYKKQEREAINQGKNKIEVHIAKDFETNLLDFIQKNPGKDITMDIIYRIALNHFREGNYKDALTWYNRFFKLGNYSELDKEKVLSSQYNMAEIYYFLKDYKQAIQSYEAIIQSFKGSEYYEKSFVRIGTAYLNMKNYKMAAIKYNEMLDAIPETEYKSLVNYNLGISYRELKDFKKSNEAFLRYYGINKDNITPDLLQLMIDVGDSYLNIREFDLANYVYKMILDKLSTDKKIYVQYRIAEVYDKSFRTKEAIEEYSNLIDLEPKENTTRLSGLIKLAELYKSSDMYKEAYDTYKLVYDTTDNEKWKKTIEYNMNELKALL